jgi:hypothetical protein
MVPVNQYLTVARVACKLAPVEERPLRRSIRRGGLANAGPLLFVRLSLLEGAISAPSTCWTRHLFVTHHCNGQSETGERKEEVGVGQSCALRAIGQTQELIANFSKAKLRNFVTSFAEDSALARY